MRRRYIWLLGALGIWLGGCEGIYSEQPLGEEIAVLNPEKVDGLWLVPGGGLAGARVLDAQKGLLQIWAANDSRAGQKPAIQCEPPPSSEVWVLRRQRDGESSLYFKEKKYGGLYLTVFTLLSDGEWWAIAYEVSSTADETLRKLIKQRLVPGRIEPSGKVILGALTSEHYRLILSEKSGLFRWKALAPYLKLPPELDPCKKAELDK